MLQYKKMGGRGLPHSSKVKKMLVALISVVFVQVFLFSGGIVIAPAYAGDNDTPVIEKGTPRIQVDRDFVDYGKVPLQQKINHRTIIKNVGDAPLKVGYNCPEHEGMIHTTLLEGC